MAKIFISFIHEEKDTAEDVQRYINDQLGEKAFMSSDQWQIFAGENWLERIKKELLPKPYSIIQALDPTFRTSRWGSFELFHDAYRNPIYW